MRPLIVFLDIQGTLGVEVVSEGERSHLESPMLHTNLFMRFAHSPRTLQTLPKSSEKGQRVEPRVKATVAIGFSEDYWLLLVYLHLTTLY